MPETPTTLPVTLTYLVTGDTEETLAAMTKRVHQLAGITGRYTEASMLAVPVTAGVMVIISASVVRREGLTTPAGASAQVRAGLARFVGRTGRTTVALLPRPANS
ncbi:hypothetical protein ACXR2T_10110 [Leucobacter sp. HY1910]